MGGPRPLSVDLSYGLAYSDEKVIEIAHRFIDAGFDTATKLELPLRESPHFVEDDWEVYVAGTETDQGTRIRIRLYLVEPDRDAAEVLTPLAEALGTVP
ncbi:MAG: hypothetical protein DWP92_05520 [Armatimonadetes bacterium]|nr:MAG: hypothetical protein DWP92_05520 [Armatimonadota bacterium]